MSVKIITKSGEVIETEETFATIQRAMVNKVLIEIRVGNNKKFINPDSIESIEAAREEPNALYKQNAGRASNFPFQQTPEETKAMQRKLQPQMAMFEAKAEAMKEMKAKEDEAINNSYAKKYMGYMPETPEAEVPTETTGFVQDVLAPEVNIPVIEVVVKKKAGRPPKV